MPRIRVLLLLVLVVCRPSAEGQQSSDKTPAYWVERLAHDNPLVREEVLLLLAKHADKSLLPQLQPLLKDPVPMVRVRAALTAVKCGDAAALQIVEQTIKEASPAVRAEAFRALFTAPAPEYLPLLRGAFLDSDRSLSDAARIALLRSKADLTPLALELLESDNAARQSQGLQLLHALGDRAKNAFPELRKRLAKLPVSLQGPIITMLEKDSKTAAPATTETTTAMLIDHLRLGTAFNKNQTYLRLRRLQPLPKDAIPALAGLLEKETGDARVYAAILLAELAPNNPKLIEALDEGLASKSSSIPPLALAAVQRLGPLGKPLWPKVLQEIESTNPSMRMPAAACAAQMGKDALAPLEQFLLRASKSKTRVDYVARALGKIGAPATPTILRLLERDNPELNYYMAVALTEIKPKPPETLEYILRLYRDKDYKIRRLAIDYLAEVMPITPEVTDALWQGLEESDSLISGKCFAALRRNPPERSKWVPAIKKRVERTGSPALLVYLYELDAREADDLLPSVVLNRLSYGRPREVAPLLCLEKKLPLPNFTGFPLS